MNKRKILILTGIAMAITNSHGQTQKNIDDIIASMTLEQKAHIVVGTGMKNSSNGQAVVGSTKDLVAGAAGTTFSIPELGVTPMVVADGPAGLRIDPTRTGDSHTYYCTYFPIGTMLASTWNTQLVSRIGSCIGDEALHYGVDIMLSPAVNIQRDPLCGRNFEYYSEDPLLAGKIGAAYINGIQKQGVGTSIKHFAVNNQETNRQGVDAIVSQRALREIYLKPFEIAIKEAKPWTVMSSYNKLNGIYTSESRELLTTILRDEWGYKGMVMTDWYGGTNAVAQMTAGNDLLMPGRKEQYDAIVEAVKTGKLDEKTLNTNVRRILLTMTKTPRYANYKFDNTPDLNANSLVAREAAQEGIVMLKNSDTTLPLIGKGRIALYGCSSYRYIKGGSGSGKVNSTINTSMIDALSQAGYKIDDALNDIYSKYLVDADLNTPKPKGMMAQFMPTPLPEELLPNESSISLAACDNDVAIITLGRLSGEFVDRKLNDFSLSTNEKELLNRVCNAFHKQGKKVVVVLNIGAPIETASWKQKPDAILLAWQGGQESCNAIADILTGHANPSGRLPMTLPVAYDDVPSAGNFPIDVEFKGFGQKAKADAPKVRNVDYTNYEEGVYVGYRHYTTQGKAVSYPFGYGLSYTQFDYTNATAQIQGDSLIVECDVRNSGKMTGKDVVQMYVSAPKTKCFDKPSIELKAFCKTKQLVPGESQHIRMSANRYELASFHEDKNAWVVDNGTYNISIGASCVDIKAKTCVNMAKKEWPVIK